jgi:hypothetical protein
MKFFLFILFLGLVNFSFAKDTAPKLRYNWVDKEWHFAVPSAKLKYNFMSKKYEFVNEPAKLEHNWVSDSWEYKSSIDAYHNNEDSD